MKCIDVHTHLGDVCKPYSSSTTALSEKSSVNDSPNLLEKLDYPDLLVKVVASNLFPKRTLQKYCRQAAAKATVLELLGSMKKADITMSFVLPIAPAVSTDEVLGMCNGSPALVPLISVDFSRNDANHIYKYLSDQKLKYPFKGIKFHPNLQGIHPGSAEAQALYEAAHQLDLFVLMHVGKTPFLPKLQGTLALLKNVLNIPATFPKTRFIFCHMAKYFDPTNDGYEQLGKYRNVWLDTSGVSGAMILKGMQSVGHDRVIFGSDWPYGDPIIARKRLLDASYNYSRSTDQEINEILGCVYYKNAQMLIQ